MAWNEPGGGRNNNQDPWGGRNDQGPPDIDEVVKKLQERFGGFFNGKKGGNQGGGGTFLLVGVLVLVALLWFISGWYRVEQAEQAVVLRFGEFHEIKTAGLRWNPALVDTIYKVDVNKVFSLPMRATMLTEDQNIVDVDLNVQYRVNDPKLYFLHVNNPELALAHSIESALRHVVGGSVMDKVITEGREAIAIEVEARLQDYLERYQSGLIVTKVNIEDAHPPKEVKAAFDDVLRAQEDEVRLQNEAQAYANGIIPEARGKAKRMLQEADAYKTEVVERAKGEAKRFEQLLSEYKKAPEVTRQRLYLETMESVYGNTTKVMVDVEGGNNIMYLPLDRLVQNASAQQLTDIAKTITMPVKKEPSKQEKNLKGVDRLRQMRDSRRWEGR
ncbi:MAG: FtsH protease activity modulator HflK [Gammaproteobacteria bacterium]|nr:MAG: FtsH protease activity modulator HflK [Gammaproteobacteria bacterium]